MSNGDNGCVNVRDKLYSHLKRIMHTITKEDKAEKLADLKALKEYKSGRFSEYFEGYYEQDMKVQCR